MHTSCMWSWRQRLRRRLEWKGLWISILGPHFSHSGLGSRTDSSVWSRLWLRWIQDEGSHCFWNNMLNLLNWIWYGIWYDMVCIMHLIAPYYSQLASFSFVKWHLMAPASQISRFSKFRCLLVFAPGWTREGGGADLGAKHGWGGLGIRPGGTEKAERKRASCILPGNGRCAPSIAFTFLQRAHNENSMLCTCHNGSDSCCIWFCNVNLCRCWAHTPRRIW